MLPACLVMDFVVWPDEERTLDERYVGGMTLVTLSFLVVSLASDTPTNDIESFMTNTATALV